MTIAWVTNWVCSSENKIHTVNDTVCIRLVFASTRCAHSNEVQITNLPFASTIFIISSFFGVVFFMVMLLLRSQCMSHNVSEFFFHVRFVYLVTMCPKFTYRAEKMNCLFVADIQRVVDGLKRVACFWWMVQHQIEKWLRAQTVNDVMGNKAVFRTNDRYACWRKKGHCTQETLFFKKKRILCQRKKTLFTQRHQFAVHFFDLLFAKRCNSIFCGHIFDIYFGMLCFE